MESTHGAQDAEQHTNAIYPDKMPAFLIPGMSLLPGNPQGTIVA